MTDQGIELWTPLGGENRGNGGRVGGRARQTIDRLRRNEDQPSRLQGCSGCGYLAVADSCIATFTLAGI